MPITQLKYAFLGILWGSSQHNHYLWTFDYQHQGLAKFGLPIREGLKKSTWTDPYSVGGWSRKGPTSILKTKYMPLKSNLRPF